PLLGLVGRHEELHLHLLELERAEDEVPRRDLVAERLADLRDAERRLLARVLKGGLEVEEDALRGLGAEVDGRPGLLHGADLGLEHQVELARLGEVAVLVVPGELRGGVAAADVGVLGDTITGLREVVGSEAQVAASALDQRIAEPGQMAGRLPGARVLDDRRVQGDDVVALLDHRPPPGVRNVVLQQYAVVAVVVGVGDPAVDLRGREDESAPLAERDDLVHGHLAGHWVEQATDPEDAAVSGASCERNVTIRPLLGYVGGRWLEWPCARSPISPRGSSGTPRGCRCSTISTAPSRPGTPEASLSGTHILRVPCLFTSIAASEATRSR